MQPKVFAAFLLVLFLIPLKVSAHGDAEKVGQLSFIDPVNSIAYSLIIVLVLVTLSVIFRNRLTEGRKKAFFILILIPVIFSTVYLAASRVYLNLASESGGPVHWHADFEIWVCGEKVLLKEPAFLESMVGTPVLHHHNEGADLNGTYRIHVEGVVAKKSEVNLQHFFEAIGDYLHSDSIGIFLKDGTQKRWTNGDACPNTGKPGTLKVFVNGKQIDNAPEYVISPYTQVPPGDFIKIVFG